MVRVNPGFNLLDISVLTVLLLSSALGLVLYIFESLSLYQIAKRRGIRNYGLAWVPIGSTWILGAIGDQYKRVRTGRRSSLRWWLLGLIIAACVAGVAMIVIWIGIFVTSIAYGDYLTDAQALSLLPTVLAGLGLYFLTLGLGIAANVLQFISLYRLYRSARPNNATVFTVLSIVFTVTIPFFLFASRKYDAPIDPINPTPYPPMPNMPTESDE